MNTKRFYILSVSTIVIVIGLWAFYNVSFWASRGGQSAPLYSVRRYDPYGTAALFELLRARGIQVNTLERSRPSRTDHGVIIQVLPVQSTDDNLQNEPQQLHTHRLKDWIAQGNTVVQLTATRTDLMTACQVPFGEQRPDTKLWQSIEENMNKGIVPDKLPGDMVYAYLKEQKTWTRNRQKHSIELRCPTPLASDPTGTWRPLAQDSLGNVVAATQRVGLGRLVIVASPTMVLNGSLATGAHLDMILDIVGDDPVLFDEWSHGIGQGGTIIGIIKSLGLTAVVFQLVFVVALYIWSTMGHRRAEIVHTKRQRSSVEQIVTLGYLYHRSMSARQITQRSRQEIKRRLAAALRCPTTGIEKKLASLKKDSLAMTARNLWFSISASPQHLKPVCPRCGTALVDLFSNTCPDCGGVIGPPPRRQPTKVDTMTSDQHDAGAAEFDTAKLLTQSYELVRELNRERNR